MMHLHPGEHIKDELKERSWTQAALAEVMGRPTQFINKLINGKKSVTPRTAKELALAFDTSAHMWLEFQNGYDLDHPKTKHVRNSFKDFLEEEGILEEVDLIGTRKAFDIIKSERDELLGLLREYQWSARRGKHGTQKCCPCCLNFEKDGVHSSDCGIGNALEENK